MAGKTLQPTFKSSCGARTEAPWDDIMFVTDTRHHQLLAPQLLCGQAKREWLRHEALEARMRLKCAITGAKLHDRQASIMHFCSDRPTVCVTRAGAGGGTPSDWEKC